MKNSDPWTLSIISGLNLLMIVLAVLTHALFLFFVGSIQTTLVKTSKAHQYL